MRFISRISGAAVFIALIAQPAGAVVINMPIIDKQGSPVPGITITSNWGGGKFTTLKTDATGRLKGDVPEGEHKCSVWSEGTHVGSGTCDFTTDKSSGNNASEASNSGNSQISPPKTSAEKAASRAIDIDDESNRSINTFFWGGRRRWRDYMIIRSVGHFKKGKMTTREYKSAAAFGVLLADLFGLSGDGAGDGDGGGDGGN